MTGRRFTLAFFTALVGMALLWSAGCNVRETNVERGDREQILFLGNGTEPQGLDVHVVTGVSEHNILAAIFEGLVSEDPVDLHPVPGVAERWDISEDGLTYTFHLRGDAKWSNGDPVTAGDFAFSFQRILEPALASQYAYMLHVLKNAEAYNSGELTDFSQVGVKVINDRTLELQLGGPAPYFLELVNHYSWWPVHPPTILKFGKIDERATPWTRVENIVTNGAFRMKEWRLQQFIVVEKDPDYWDADRVKLQEIHFYPIESYDTEERAFRTDLIHVTNTVPLHRIDAYREKWPEQLRFDTYLGTYFYRMNTNKPPLDDVRVRRALALALDREQLIKYVLKGAGQTPAFGMVPPGTGGYQPPDFFKADVDEARRLLTEAGYPGGKGIPEIELLINTSESHKVLGEAVVEMWEKSLGVKVSIMNQEWKVYLSTVQKEDYQMARAGWIGDYNDPNTFLDMWLTGGGNNNTGFSNEHYDDLIAKAGKTSDADERFNYFLQAEQILIDEMPILPIYFYVSQSLVKPSVRNWHPTLLDHHPYKYVYLDPSAKTEPSE